MTAASDRLIPPEARATIADQVRTDRLRLLFRQSFIAVFGSYITAVLLGWLLWDRGDQTAIATWLLLLGLALLSRLALFAAWYRAPEAERVPQRWERPYWATLLITASLWGFGALIVMPKDSHLHQIVTLFFCIGMAGSALSTYSSYRAMTLSGAGLVLLPCAGWLLLQASPLQYGSALAALFFAISALRATREVSGAMETSLRLSHEMEWAYGIADRAAHTDELTGLGNRRAFFERGQQMLSYCQRNRHDVAAIALDIDHFKRINDTRGHQAGDAVLRQIGLLLQGAFRDADACGRLGGEEFAVLLADTPPAAAAQLAEKLRASIAALVIDLPEPLQITASLGVATTNAVGYDLQTLLQQADAAMYRAKAAGRNQVCGPDDVSP